MVLGMQCSNTSKLIFIQVDIAFYLNLKIWKFKILGEVGEVPLKIQFSENEEQQEIWEDIC